MIPHSVFLIALENNPLGSIDPRYFIAGGLCASISHGITTPVDVVKTRIQSDPQKYDGLNVLEASKVVVNDDGSGALLKGFGPTVTGYGLEGAAKFGIYESLKPVFVGYLETNSAFIIASVVAGGVASVILCPLERTRIRLVTDPNFSKYNVVTGIQRLIEESGIASLFSGLPAMLSKQCPYTLGKQVTYDAVCAALYSSSIIINNNNQSIIRFEVSFLAACCAAVVACLLSQPGDVILTETYKDSSSSDAFPDVVSTIYKRGGFYSGIVARLIQVGGIITTQLLLYDFLKQSLGLPATGST